MKTRGAHTSASGARPARVKTRGAPALIGRCLIGGCLIGERSVVVVVVVLLAVVVVVVVVAVVTCARAFRRRKALAIACELRKVIFRPLPLGGMLSKFVCFFRFFGVQE